MHIEETSRLEDEEEDERIRRAVQASHVNRRVVDSDGRDDKEDLERYMQELLSEDRTR